MTCPSCSTANAEDALFCIACGTPLGSPCAVCGAVDPLSARFCRTCGSPRTPIDGSAGTDGERRIVSVLFADMVGSTAVAERMDPEDWAEVAQFALEAMARSVEQLGGTVARMMGDGILALFGAPHAQEDDAERAVRAGLDVVDAAGIARRRARELGATVDGDQLRVRVGVATGPVVAGIVGGGTMSEYTVLGDAANLAARLEKLARPGTVLIAAATRRAVEHAIDAASVGSLEVRGRETPVEAFRVLGIRSERGSARGPGTRVPLIGRETELRRLQEAVSSVASGRGGIMMVFGEPGIGKSRILEDLISWTREHNPEVRLWHAQALSFEAERAYALARGLLHAMESDVTARLAEHVAGLSEQRRGLVDDVLAIVQDRAATSSRELTPTVMGLAFGDVLDAGTAHRPAVIVLDDLHWSDAASAEIVMSLFARTERAPLLLICAARPDRSGPAWRVKHLAETEYPHRYSETHIRALDSDESRALVTSLLAVPDVPSEVIAAIGHRTDGNPFFLEEIVRELVETGVLAEKGDDWALVSNSTDRLPATLQQLLQVRFDRLSADDRAVLEAAAVIGRSFTIDLVTRVVGREADIHELLKVGLIEQEPEPSPRFRFRHALAQEAAYEAILHRRRRVLHQHVGEGLEAEVRADGAGAEVTAMHFAASGDAPKAARYSLEAGERAFRLGAIRDGAAHFERGIAALTAEVPEQTVIRLFLGRGRSREVQGDIDGALEDLGAALDGARAVRDDRLEWQVLVALGEVSAARDYRRTGDFYEQALDAARGIDDPEMVGTSLNRLGNWYVNATDPLRGIELHAEALSIFDRLASPEGVAASHDLLGMAHVLGGGREAALHHSTRALAAFRELGDRRGAIGALINVGIGAPAYSIITEVPTTTAVTAEESLREALALVTDLGWSAAEAYARFVLSQVLASTGRLGAGIREADASLRLADAIRHDQWRIGALLSLGAAEADALDLDSSRAHLLEANRLAESVGSLNWTLQVGTSLGVTLVRLGHIDHAEDIVQAALQHPDAEKFAPHQGCVIVEAMIAVERGRSKEASLILARLPGAAVGAPHVGLVRGAALSEHDPTEAEKILREGLATAQHWGMLPLEWRFRLALGRLPGTRSDEHMAEAGRVLGRCAESLDEPDRRARMVEEARARHGVEAVSGTNGDEKEMRHV
jgi:class 3 adenylate cyclase